MNEPRILFVGVGIFLAAIALSSAAHLAHHASGGDAAAAAAPAAAADSGLATTTTITADERPAPQHGRHAAATADPTSPASTDSVRLLQSGAPAYGWHAVRGLLVSAAGGLCFGFFSPLFNIAINDEFGWMPGGRAGGLTVWTANFFFCSAFCATAWLANLVLMRWPHLLLYSEYDGAAPRETSSSLGAYMTEGLRARGLACATGALCAVGNTAQFVGGAAAGFAAADLVQAYPLVGTAVGIRYFGEFRGATRRVRALLACMALSYLCAVGLLIASVRGTHAGSNSTLP
jgi:hypothetical protein